MELKLDLKPGHSHPKRPPGSRRANNYSLSSALCAPHHFIPIPIPGPVRIPITILPAPPVILAVMDIVEARAVFVPKVLEDYKGILRLTIKM
ncbi:hypothetical protein M5D96_000322 [Drosophila gunungcola]|uniref:Uncharacterized protein n=1 Tax=Drosophila gunungcola TaxID=103775 RepID=A0A9P9YW39_9MUSC|nr:hypothetical protein M5D96_000322 [Drosophila gunungcola]